MANAPLFLGKNSTYTNTGAYPLTCPLPTGLAAGQLLLVVFAAATSNDITSHPAGWTLVESNNQVSTGTAKMALAWARYTVGMAEPTFGLSAASTAKGAVACIAYTADAEDPVFGTSLEATGTSLAPQITTTVANTRVLNINVQRTTNPTSVTKPAEHAERHYFANGGGGSTGILLSDEVVPTAATINRTTTVGTSSSLYGVLVAIAPAASTPPPVSSAVKVWVGGAWVDAERKIRSGGVWV